jgi:C1A family cysteine protease
MRRDPVSRGGIEMISRFSRASLGLRLAGLVGLAALFVLALSWPGPLHSGSDAQLTQAPLNPEFIRFMEARAQGAVTALTPDGHFLGLIPSRHLLPQPAGPSPSDLAQGALPSWYDLRTQGKLTPIRNQGGCGSCWSFATYGSLESYLLPGESTDYSENDLIQKAGFDLGPCDGGNMDMAMAYLARWAGPVNEADNPYPYYSQVEGGAAVLKHVQGAAYLPNRNGPADDTPIREAVVTTGAVYISMSWCSLAYNGTHHSYYNDGSYAVNGGHAVCVVGWDDDFPATSFNKTAPGNGAYIVRNSWGTGWGESGYFYVSYYDHSFGLGGWGTDATALTAEPTNNYSSAYQYDPLGWVNSWGYGTTSAWGANIFTAASAQPITAVGFYAASAGTSYAIYVYTGVSAGKPRSGSLQVSTSGSVSYAGYYTIDLPVSVPLSGGQKFSVVIKLTTPGFQWPIPTEDYVSGWSSGATSSPGQSFIDLTGTVGTAWQDVSAGSSRSNVCLKAFTSAGGGSGTITVTSPALGDSWYRGGIYPILWTSSGVTGQVAIQLMRGSTQVKSIVNPTANDGSYSWKIPAKLATASDYSIRVRTTNGQVAGDSETFSICAPSLAVTSPHGGESWYPGETHAITWTCLGTSAPKVTIHLMRGSTVAKTIAKGAPNSGSYSWKIPAALAPRGYQVRVKTTDGAAQGTSAEFWVERVKLDVVAPGSGAVWPRGTTQTILWETQGVNCPTVTIILRRNGTKVRDISPGTANDWDFDWLIPLDLAAGGGYDIKITASDGTAKGVSPKFSLS